jgi:predicted amidohydrolase
LAYRKTGIGFYEILKLIIDISIKNFNRGTLKPIAEKILNRELKPYRQQKNAFEKFKADGVCEIDLKVLGSPYVESDKNLSLTLCPMSFNTDTDFSRDHGLSFPSGLHEKLDLKIESAINEARKQRASALVFPELCLPRRYLFRYLDRCAANELLLIAGVEYTCDHANFCRNSTIISFPVNAQRSPYAKNYIAFEQDKHFPAAEEKHQLEHNNKFKYKPGENLFVFKSKKYLNFSVLTCSDFLSIGLRFKLQNRIQTVFVPAQNPDTTSYNHIAESCIRDLHCFAVVCNNQQIGGSFVYAPFHDRNKRAVFRKDGASLPEFLTIKWEPHVVLPSQNADSQDPFRPSLKEKNDWNPKLKDMKQTPPDWGY